MPSFPCRLAALALAGIATLCAPVAQAEARKVAIIVANANYAQGALQNPLNDADLISIAAQDLGFEVVGIRDAGIEHMRQQVASAIASAKGADVLMLYYAGHGVQSEGRNYLLPVDMKIRSASDLAKQGLSLGEVMSWLSSAAVPAALVFLDACRDNPLTKTGTFEPGLAFVESGTGEVLLSYAAAAGDVAYDGFGLHSPYTTALVEAMRTPNLEIYEMLRQVRGRVRQITDGRQIPWVSGSIERKIVLNTRVESVEAPSARDDDWLDDTAWNTIRNSNNPSYFEDFLQDFPTSPLRGEAARKIEVLASHHYSPIRVAYSASSAAGPAAASPLKDPLSRTIDPCDVLAASDADPRRFGLGIPFYAISFREAILACTKAVARQPREPRFLYQLARALAVADRWDESARFAALAADRGYPEGYSLLAWINAAGFGRPKEPARAIELWRTGSSLGSPNARSNLGRSYRDGFAVSPSVTDAVYWFRLAATSGEKVAADDLANMYRDGTGVPADLGEAMRWYRLGAALGSSNAMTTLGNLYRDGKGVAADSRMAEYWYRLATAGGNRFAPFQHARMLLEDKGKAREEEALRLLLLSGDRGFAEAYARAADIYEGGRRRDLERAYYYALLASGSGLQNAPATAKRLRAKLPAQTASRTERSAARWLEDNGEAARVAAYAK